MTEAGKDQPRPEESAGRQGTVSLPGTTIRQVATNRSVRASRHGIIRVSQRLERKRPRLRRLERDFIWVTRRASEDAWALVHFS
jgi:hypothetical protein